jgi:Carbohydrate/starch-binding module (family 21)
MKKLFITLCTALMAWTASTAPAIAADEVKLLRSNSIVLSRYGVGRLNVNFQSIRFEALVKNLAYAKQVSVRIKRPDGTWVDAPLAYQRAADAGREVWAADYVDQNTDGTGPSYKTFDLEFALRYQVNGTEYWDNNNGANYKQAKDSGSFLVGTNVLNRAFNLNGQVETFSGEMQGTLTVKNLAPSKQVKVVYSTDGWKTSNTAWATFDSGFYSAGGNSFAANPNQYGNEEWKFSLNTGKAVKVEYAIGYMVNGTTYWDNNFGRNYKQALLPRSY